jgi:hypothetical protein
MEYFQQVSIPTPTSAPCFAGPARGAFTAPLPGPFRNPEDCQLTAKVARLESMPLLLYESTDCHVTFCFFPSCIVCLVHTLLQPKPKRMQIRKERDRNEYPQHSSGQGMRGEQNKSKPVCGGDYHLAGRMRCGPRMGSFCVGITAGSCRLA